MKTSGKAIIFAIIAILFFGVTFAVISLTRNAGKPANQVTKESAESLLERRAAKIRVNQLPPIMESVDLEAVNVADSLPDISKYPPQVENTTQDYIEIFSSTEKATVTGTAADNDRWLVDLANSFNKSTFVIDGRAVSVRIRGIASGLGMDYISSGKYVPDAYTPSNELWGDALREAGVKIELVEKSLTGNVAGVALRKNKNDEIISKYGSVSLKNIIEAVTANELAFGYTNPFSSSTGANFLISALYAFDPSNPLSDESVTAFTNFQSNIPFVAHTTLQMKDAASSGALDGFVFESQQFANSPDLRADYVFTPFGLRHDNPVYALNNLPDMQRKNLDEFISFAKS
jgi:Ca-activated chloride channel family protein